MRSTRRPMAWALAGLAGAGALLLFVAGLVEAFGARSAGSPAWLLPTAGLVVVALTWALHRLRRERVQLRQALEELKRIEDGLRQRVFHDPLTKLANRELFHDRLEHALALRTREAEPVAVLFLDLDDLKAVNDGLGHAAGDELLVAAAERIRSCVRPSDTTARLGGDEFAVLLEETAAPDGAIRTAERILRSLQEPFLLEGREVTGGASVGIALSDASLDKNGLLRNADIAMYRAKSQGKDRYALYAPEMHEVVFRRRDLRPQLQRAMEG